MAARFTAKEFETFKAEFLKWQERLGLTGYKVYFKHEPLDENFAELRTTVRCNVATAALNDSLPEKDIPFGNALDSAKHEALHLMVNRVCNLARCRYTSPDEIGEAEEELVRKLEKLIA